MEETITNLLETYFTTEAEFQDCFVVDVNHSNKKLEVFVDSDSGMTFAKCQRISRYLESYLDEAKPLGEEYVLDVSSPGVDRPLKFYRQYLKNVGRTLEVTTTEGETYTGVLKAATPTEVTLEAKQRVQDGKRKKTVVEDINIASDAIKKSIVKISF
ncbi:ribosome maturation factor RimP [Lewinella marina]|uniref:Ribosome maturation factor RimP n=1 Tax=Neolewinella marina TaxID=438751 RepID=A0A2G0CBR4_9BACT|nr:ribosome maturation factor [Neolewinella marina]NJB87050.1 ribosome maturation factor RimP [Neolewinella marina]PHK97414.1 ribosome maturation factor [Neolewinella marina]